MGSGWKPQSPLYKPVHMGYNSIYNVGSGPTLQAYHQSVPYLNLRKHDSTWRLSLKHEVQWLDHWMLEGSLGTLPSMRLGVWRHFVQPEGMQQIDRDSNLYQDASRRFHSSVVQERVDFAQKKMVGTHQKQISQLTLNSGDKEILHYHTSYINAVTTYNALEVVTHL